MEVDSRPLRSIVPQATHSCTARFGSEEAHPVVPGSSTYRGGERNLKLGVGFQFFRCLELLIRMAVASIFGLLAQRDCRDADRSQLLNALSRPPQTASSYHILGYLGQRDEHSNEL